MPSRSIRWPPVSLTIGTSHFSATSAILRSWAGVVTPPFICGTTEKVPSFWMLACTRSLMNRASFSSMYSSAHIILSSEARPILDFASSAPSGASAANTAETDFSPCSRMAAISSGLSIGMPGTYQFADGSSSTAPPAAHSTIWQTMVLQEPQPLPALVLSITPATDLTPLSTQATSAPLETPLQLQTWASSASSATPTSSAGVPRLNSISSRSSGSGSPRSNACIRNATLDVSPSIVAPMSFSSRMTSDL